MVWPKAPKLYFNDVSPHSVTNDQMTGHLSLILDIYASWNLACFLKILILKPSILSQRTKIGLNWSKNSLMKLKSQFNIYLKMPSQRLKTTHYAPQFLEFKFYLSWNMSYETDFQGEVSWPPCMVKTNTFRVSNGLSFGLALQVLQELWTFMENLIKVRTSHMICWHYMSLLLLSVDGHKYIKA